MRIQRDVRSCSATTASIVLAFSLFISVSIRPLPAAALLLPDGRTKVCHANPVDLSYANPDGTVPEIIAQPFALGGTFALTSFPPLGPLKTSYDVARINQTIAIAFGQYASPAEIQIAYELNAYHECAHARLHLINEFAANCEAIREMRMYGLETPANEPLLAAYHQSFGPIGMQYGGTGAAFWARTMACANSLPPLQLGGPDEDVPPF